MKNILVIGGASGIGLSIATELVQQEDCQTVHIVDRQPFPQQFAHPKIRSHIFDLTNPDYSFFDQFADIDVLMITAGFGKIQLFRDVEDQHITDSFYVNTIAPIRIIKIFYPLLSGKKDFYCGVMGSIAGFMSSPFLSIYASTKASLKIFIESVNVELLKAGTSNRILNVSPGFIKGTSFYKGKTDIDITRPLAIQIIQHLKNKDDLFIPKYEEVYKEVLQRYHNDFRAEGIHSYEYKEQTMDKR